MLFYGCLLLALELAAVGYDNISERFVVAVHLDLGYAVECILTGDQISEEGMFCIQMRAFVERDEEPVCVLSMKP